MKYKVGDKIKIVRATTGCHGAEGKIGIITNRPSTNGLTCHKDGFNVDCGDENVWRIGFESECELLDELTAAEATKILGEICCENKCLNGCPIGKVKGNITCQNFRKDKAEQVIEILKQWKKDHEKKKIETEIVDLVRVMNDETCIYVYEIDVNKENINDKMRELVKEYSGKQDSKIYAKYERLCRVKS